MSAYSYSNCSSSLPPDSTAQKERHTSIMDYNPDHTEPSVKEGVTMYSPESFHTVSRGDTMARDDFTNSSPSTTALAKRSH